MTFLAIVMVMIWAAVKRWLACVFLAGLGYVASLRHCILFYSSSWIILSLLCFYLHSSVLLTATFSWRYYYVGKFPLGRALRARGRYLLE